MAAAYCNGREAALAVGAAKAGIGHAEAASGMAGVCKVAQQLRRLVVVGNTKLRVLNPLVRERLGAGGAAVLASQPLVSAGGSCGLSAFGYSGTIAHALFTALAATNCLFVPAPARRCTLRRREFAWRDPVHPLLQLKLPTVVPALARFRAPVAGPLRALVSEHIVRGRVVFPGAAYLEMARAASSAFAASAGGISLSEVFFLRPLMLPDGMPKLDDAAWLECALLEDGGFELRSGAEGASSDDFSATHCVGRYGAAVADGWRHVDETAVRETCVVPADTAAFYASFAAGGLEYGPAYRRVEALWVSETGAEATSRLLPRTNLQRTHVHPADLDGALQSTKVLASGEGASGQIRLPFSIDTALLRGKASGPLWAVRARPRIGARLNPHTLPSTP